MMNTKITAKELLEMADNGNVSHDRLLQLVMALYGTGTATTDFVGNEPVMNINGKELFNFMSELLR